MSRLTRENFTGPWAGLPVAWTKDDRLDLNAYGQDVEGCCLAEVPGVYTGGTTGEFYAMDWEEFCQVAQCTVEICRQHDVPSMIGCSSTYTRGAVRPEAEVDQIAAYASTAIVKDCALDADDNPNVQTTAGDGQVDFQRVLSGLVGGGFTGPLYVECVGATEAEAVDRALAFTRGYIKGILLGL